MKKIVLLLGLIALSFVVTGQGIHFEQGNFEQVLAKAKAERKMVFIDAYAVWCGPCKWMSNNVFSDAEVGTYFEKYFVALKLDVERGEGPAIKTRYAIEGLPGYLFMDSDGNVVYRGSGSMAKEKFMILLEEARAAAIDPNSVGRMAVRYTMEKDNETFLKEYLEKLQISKSAGYYDVVEQYLKIQKSMAPGSGEMVKFLYDNRNSLVFGGVADKILSENLWTYPWDKYVRKDIRYAFQNLPDALAKQTTEYAILKKDTTLLDLAVERVAAYGLKPQDGQRERLLIYYYSATGEGEKYKMMVKPQIDTFYNTLNVSELRKGYERAIKIMEKDPSRKIRPYAMIHSERLRSMVSEYVRFVNTIEEYKMMMKWVNRIYELFPEEIKNVAFYAKGLYMSGEDKDKAIRLMTGVVEKGKNEKNTEGFAKDLEAMKAGQPVVLTF